MRLTTCAIILLSVLFPSVFSANILFFFAGGNVSHKTGVWPWVLAMASRGHKVTFLSPHEKTPKAHPNITDLVSVPLQKMMASVYQVDRFKERDLGIEKIFEYNSISAEICKSIVDGRYTDPALSQVFRTSYDLVVVNAIFGECGYFLSKYFEAKIIAYNTCTLLGWSYDVYGIAPETAWIPDLIFTSKEIPLGILKRAYNTYLEVYWTIDRWNLSPMLEEVTKPLLGSNRTTSLYELENTVSFVFLNAHPAIDFARTLPPLFVDVGGMGSTSSSQKKLPENFRNFMDSSGPGGAVLITFGSTILLNKVSLEYQAMFFEMIGHFPEVNFLMRWSGPLPSFLNASPKNLLVSEWLPQMEILGHPKLKLFITHGGISGVQEATYNGIPMIVMPLFADQDYNAYRIVAQEVGERVEIRGMTAHSLISVVDKVLTDSKYKKNMIKKSTIFRERPLSPVDNAVFWTEFALRHDDIIGTFRPQNQHLNMFQRRLVDVFLLLELIILAALVVAFYVLKLAIKLVWRIFRRNHHSKGMHQVIKELQGNQRKTRKAD